MARRPVVDPSGPGGSSARFSLPAPVGGWNARDPLAEMPPTDAIYLDNLFPTLGAVQLRPGNTRVATLPVGSLIKSLLTCQKADGTTKKFAVAQDGVYDITAGGTVGASAYTLTNAQVEYQNINVGGTNYLWCCVGDGVNDCFIYRSDTGAFQVLNAGSTPALTGITSNKVSNVYLWQNRIILTEKDSMKWYYLPLNSVGGAAVSFDMGQIFRLGGYITRISDWSVDTGFGPLNRLVIVSSEGEIGVFQGTDPSIASAFSLVGVYQLGRPLSKRCTVPLPGDVAILTESGLWPLSKIMAMDTYSQQVALSDKIRNAFVAYAQVYGTLYGWQPKVFHGGQALIVNVPITSVISYQFVMNLSTKAWCRFTAWNATCIEIMDGKLYFAMGRFVYQGWTGHKDGLGAITGRVKQAFTYPNRHGISHVKLARPILNADKGIELSYGIDTDFADSSSYSSSTSYIQALTKWGEAIWGASVWSSGNGTISSWKTVSNKPGRAFSYRMKISGLDVAVSWPTTDFIAQRGGLF